MKMEVKFVLRSNYKHTFISDDPSVVEKIIEAINKSQLINLIDEETGIYTCIRGEHIDLFTARRLDE